MMFLRAAAREDNFLQFHFEYCFILNAISFALSRIRCIQWKQQKSFDVKGKISREDKDGFSKQPSQGNNNISADVYGANKKHQLESCEGVTKFYYWS